MQKRTSLIIAAHPDDEILGCGGVIKKLSGQGMETHVFILTDGSNGRYDIQQTEKHKVNARKASKFVGVDQLYIEDLPNQGLDAIPLLQVITKIEACIQKVSPEIVFTHHAGDLNKDHRIVYEASMTALRPLPDQTVKKIYTDYVPSSTEWNFVTGENHFVPNVFVDIKNELDDKIRAMKMYHSECREYPHPRSSEALKAVAHYWGISVGLEYCEPFCLVRDLTGEI